MLEVGIKGQQVRTVTTQDTALAAGSGELEVYATPALIALMEETAWKSVAPALEPGTGTVGTMLEISHLSATPPGMLVRCETELVEIDRRRLVFRCEAYDEAGLIASGTHERFIVNNDTFLRKARAKLK